jgi:hypothetical protein
LPVPAVPAEPLDPPALLEPLVPPDPISVEPAQPTANITPKVDP